tara:strand:- start:51 stop:1409 length:1359 start_codon:yes stop_codon:yes gene_type:complete
MTTEANPHYFATATKDDTTIDQITDDTDFPHTGLIKALSLGMKGNYAVKGSATDFDITQSATSSSVVVVKSGKIYRDGALHTVPSGGADTTFANTSFQATANTHHLLVADSSNVLQIRKHSSSTQNKIPPYDDGDTIIAIITYTSNGFNDMVVQYLTTSKVANNVSIGYGTSAYTEAMSISASAGDTTIENKVSDKDIIFKVNDGGASSESMRIDGDINQVKIKSLGIGTAAELTITESSDDITIKNTVSDKDIIFNINDGGSDTEIMRFDGSTSTVGIGTASPDANAKLSVEGAISLDEISAPTNTADRGQLYTNADNHLHFINGAGTDVKVTEEVFIVALSDETTDLTTGTAKASFNMPFAMTLTGVKANCTTAPVGSTIIVDINEAGSTILSTKLSIDASETTSTSAASAAVISDTALANDALITFDIDQIGSSTAGKGLKVTLYGYRA